MNNSYKFVVAFVLFIWMLLTINAQPYATSGSYNIGSNAAVTFNNANTIWVDASGNDANAGTSFTVPKRTISNAVAAATSGVIRLGAGTFNATTPLILAKNVSLIGLGRGVTIINNTAGGSGSVCVGPGDNSLIADLTILCTNSSVSQVPFGLTASKAVATNWTLANCDLIGNEDGEFFENSSGKIKGRSIQCRIQSKWDGVTTSLLDTNSIIDLFDCRIEIVPLVAGGNNGDQAHGIQNLGGLVRLWGGSIVTTNGPVTTEEAGISAIDAGNPLRTEVRKTSITVGPAAGALYYNGDEINVWGADEATHFGGAITFHGGAASIVTGTLVAGTKTIASDAIKTTSIITPVRVSVAGSTATLNCAAPTTGSVVVNSSNGSDTAAFKLIIVNP